MLQKIPSLTILISFMMAPLTYGQWDGFIDPAYSGTTQYSEWNLFTTTTNALPDVSGTAGSITASGAIVTSTLNIYSYWSNVDFSLSSASASNLNQVSLQFLVWGQASGLTTPPSLFVQGELIGIDANQNQIFYQQSFTHPDFGPTTYTGFQYQWDLSGLDVSDYRIDFQLHVHNSLDKVRLDTTTEALIPELTPIIPVSPDCSMVDGEMHLTFPTHLGNYYQIKWTHDIVNSGPVESWSNLGSQIVGDGNTVQVSDEDSIEQSSRFYSVIITNQ